MQDALFAGFALGFSLIMAIGSQNAFVLRQGLKKQFVLPVVMTCAISDALLIAAGVAGFGALVLAAPWVVSAAKWGGALFLFVYGVLNFRSAWQGGGSLDAAEAGGGGLWVAVTTCLLLTWANPHVYLDTVVLLGGISATYAPAWAFGIGAATASLTFFALLGFGARYLRPFFASPRAWRILDAGIGVTMWAIAATLLMS
ncbi:LysE/ArgO family amino acid transporter [Cognatishimia sp. WU-CL00825]|uniref:LysE/ArgO family amino acid transporter n=1 Tax=Cognatishimia sp. WU-CL00825 TaxID=3127658 RepID=UPI0031093082